MEAVIIEQNHERESNKVETGQGLLRIDDTLAAATLGVLRDLHNALKAIEARLIAERDGLPAIVFPAELTRECADRGGAAIRAAQENIFSERRRTLQNQIATRQQRIDHLRSEIEGHRARLAALEKQSDRIRQTITFAETFLVEYGLLLHPRLLALQQEAATLSGSRDEQLGMIAKAEQAIGEAKTQIVHLANTRRSVVARELRDTQTKLADTEGRLAEMLIITGRHEDVARAVSILRPTLHKPGVAPRAIEKVGRGRRVGMVPAAAAMTVAIGIVIAIGLLNRILNTMPTGPAVTSITGIPLVGERSPAQAGGNWIPPDAETGAAAQGDERGFEAASKRELSQDDDGRDVSPSSNGITTMLPPLPQVGVNGTGDDANDAEPPAEPSPGSIAKSLPTDSRQPAVASGEATVTAGPSEASPDESQATVQPNPPHDVAPAENSLAGIETSGAQGGGNAKHRREPEHIAGEQPQTVAMRRSDAPLPSKRREIVSAPRSNQPQSAPATKKSAAPTTSPDVRPTPAATTVATPSVVAAEPIGSDGTRCELYRSDADYAGRSVSVHGFACRDSKGRWWLINQQDQ